MIATSKKCIDVFSLFIHDRGIRAADPFDTNALQDALEKLLDTITPEPERVRLFTPDDTGRDRWSLKYWPNHYQNDKFKEVGGTRKYSDSAVRAAMPKKVLEYMDQLNRMEVTVV